MNDYVKYAAIGGVIIGIYAYIHYRPQLKAWWRNRRNKQNNKLRDSRGYQELENKSFKKLYSKKIGIPNYGNTCYLNSVLQILASTPNFVDSISKSKAILFRILSSIFSLIFSHSSASSFKPVIIQLLNILKSHYCPLSSSTNTTSTMYELYSQNDCKEIYNILIDIYIQEFSHEKKRFQLTKNQTFMCQKGHRDKNLEESLFIIIPPGYKLSVKRCLESIKSRESELDLWCEVCKEISSSIIMVDSLEMPEILAFYVTDASNKDRKPKTEINFENIDYKLYAVICYYGGGQSGHYIAYTCDDGKWNKYNDAFASEDLPDYDHAYMLFYSKFDKII